MTLSFHNQQTKSSHLYPVTLWHRKTRYAAVEAPFSALRQEEMLNPLWEASEGHQSMTPYLKDPQQRVKQQRALILNGSQICQITALCAMTYQAAFLHHDMSFLQVHKRREETRKKH